MPSNYSTALSPLEKKVLKGLFYGHKYVVIAKTLGVSQSAVDSAKRRLYDKLGAFNKVQAFNIATTRGYSVDNL